MFGFGNSAVYLTFSTLRLYSLALCVIRSCIKVSGKYKTNITQEDIDAAREDLHLSPGKILHLMYGDGSKRLSERDIEIQKIEKKGGDIYILAFCHLALDLRTFRKSRIISLTYEGRPVDDIQKFLSENSNSVETLAKQALE